MINAFIDWLFGYEKPAVPPKPPVPVVQPAKLIEYTPRERKLLALRQRFGVESVALPADSTLPMDVPEAPQFDYFTIRSDDPGEIHAIAEHMQSLGWEMHGYVRWVKGPQTVTMCRPVRKPQL